MNVKEISPGTGQRGWLERLVNAIHGEPKDRNEVVAFLRHAEQRRLLDRDALGMIEGVFQVTEMQARDIMIPRSQMSVVARNASLIEMLEVIVSSGHSRFPVIGDNRDEVIGILLAKDLLRYCGKTEGADFDLDDILRPAVFVPESKRLNMLLKEFRNNRHHLAMVVDEYGGVAGLVTIEDILEQIVGDIDDEHDPDDDLPAIQAASDGGYWIRALTPIEEFNQYFGRHYSDEEFDTIGGLVIHEFGHVPKRGERVEIDGLRFTVLKADSRRVYLLQLEIKPHA